MGKFQDLFKRKLAEQQEVAQVTVEQKQAEAIERRGLLAEFEPKLREVVLEAFEAMREAKWPKVQVLDDMTKEPSGVTAYAFTPFAMSHLTKAINAAVVIDSNGKIAFEHYVTTVGDGADLTAVSCYPLDYEYEKLLGRVERTDEPRGRELSLNSAGAVVYSWPNGTTDMDDRWVFDNISLEEHLAICAARTIAGT